MANSSIYAAFERMWQHVVVKVGGKANLNHTHEEYETKTDASTKYIEAKTYADNAANKVKNDLLNGAGDAYDTLKELGVLIDDNQDAIGALEIVATNKADKDHVHEEYETKEDSQSKYDELKSIKPDWNQNDSSAADFIKNRPFYTGDPVESVILEETTFSGFSGGQYSIGNSLFQLVEGKTYRVTWDGTDYECVGKNYSGYIMIGNNKIYAYDGTDETDTGEPFAIEIGSDSGCIYTTDNNSHTVKITLLEFEIVKIDEKYIPYKPGQAVENVTGAEIFNDYVNNTASGEYAHAEGAYNTASGDYSHAQGFDTDATGYGAHTEGGQTTASSDYAHAEGYKSTASGKYSHAQGYNTTASKEYAHAEGQNTLASSSHQHVQGKNNVEDATGKYAHIVGNGSSSSARSNAHTLDWDGNAEFKGDVIANGCGGENPISLIELQNQLNQLLAILTVTEADEGKVLKVVNGKPTWVMIPNAKEAEF